MSDSPDTNEDEEPSVIDSEETEAKKSQRQKEWGTQFDMWLIRSAKRKQLVELLLAIGYPGVTKEQNLVSCVPLRVDKYMIEVAVDGAPVWLNKQWIIGCKPLAGKVRAEGDTSSAE